MRYGQSTTIGAVMALLLLIAQPALPSAAQNTPDCSPNAGTVVTQTFDSVALGAQKTYNLYLPPNWCALDDLPLLVMLHGWSGDHTDWVSKGHIDQAADMMILAGEIEPLIILMPDGDNGFYVDQAAGDYETYVVSELVGAVDAAYPTAATRASRFIGGLSMGGYGALYLGLRYADLFSAIGAHSPALLGRGDDPPPWLYGESLELFEERDVVSIIQREGWPADMRLFVDVGNADFLMLRLYDLFGALIHQPQALVFQGHVWPGAHDWSYWSAHLPDYLRFYAGTNGQR